MELAPAAAIAKPHHLGRSCAVGASHERPLNRGGATESAMQQLRGRELKCQQFEWRVGVSCALANRRTRAHMQSYPFLLSWKQTAAPAHTIRRQQPATWTHTYRRVFRFKRLLVRTFFSSFDLLLLKLASANQNWTATRFAATQRIARQ